MKKLKTVLLSMMLVAAMVLCSSCMKSDVQVKIGGDGRSTFNMTTLFSKEDLNVIKAAVYPQMVAAYGSAEEADKYMQQTFGQIESCKQVTVDGKEYYEYVDESSFNDMQELQQELESKGLFGNISIGTDHFYAATVVDDDVINGTTSVDSMTEELGVDLEQIGLTKEQVAKMLNDSKATVTIEFPNNITYSNGKYETNSNRVTWDLAAANAENVTSEVQILYAETMDPSVLLNDKKAPTVTGIKNKGFYRKGTLKVTDQVGVAGIKVDGEASFVLSGIAGSTSSNGTVQNNIYTLDNLLEKEGKHTVKVFDFAGNKTTITFTYDTTKPVVKGIANGKTYKSARTIKFSDKYGIKSAKLNGKTIKNNKKISKKGSYTLKVTDKAGNVTTVKFKIKK